MGIGPKKITPKNRYKIINSIPYLWLSNKGKTKVSEWKQATWGRTGHSKFFFGIKAEEMVGFPEIGKESIRKLDKEIKGKSRKRVFGRWENEKT